METEIWKYIDNTNNKYQISNYGNVKSFVHKNPKILKCSVGNNGYLTTSIKFNGVYKTVSIHKLVAIAFLNHVPDGYNMVVNHIDNDKLNNHFSNLELVTPRYNASCHKTNPGVSINTKKNKYQIYFKHKKKNVFLSLVDLDDLEKANKLYNLAIQYLNHYNGNNSEFRKLIKSKL
jgi:hypothetical protein